MSYAIEYAPNTRQRLSHKCETFLVDGHRAEPRDLNEIAQAYHHADEDGRFPRSSSTPMPPGRELADAPVPVRVHHDLYASMFGVDLDVGFSDKSGWVSGTDLSPTSHLRFFFVYHNGIWRRDPRYISQMITDGWDLSCANADKFAGLVRRLVKAMPAASASDGDSTADAAVAPARSTSTEVRDTVVLRL